MDPLNSRHLPGFLMHGTGARGAYHECTLMTNKVLRAMLQVVIQILHPM